MSLAGFLLQRGVTDVFVDCPDVGEIPTEVGVEGFYLGGSGIYIVVIPLTIARRRPCVGHVVPRKVLASMLVLFSDYVPDMGAAPCNCNALVEHDTAGEVAAYRSCNAAYGVSAADCACGITESDFMSNRRRGGWFVPSLS